MDSTTDPAHLAPGLCPRLQNLLTDRPGYLRGEIIAPDVLNIDMLSSAVGIGSWYAYPQTNDILVPCTSDPVDVDTDTARLIAIDSDGQLYVSDATPDGDPPTIHSLVAVSTPSFFDDQTCRMVQMGKDTIIVQEGGNQPQRFTYWNGTPYVFQLGMCPPVVIPGGSITPGTGPVTSVRRYAATYVDEQGRESSLSVPTDFYVMDGGAAGQNTIADWTGAGAPGIQERIVNVYGTVIGTPDAYYLVGQLGDVDGTGGSLVTSIVDDILDSDLTANQQGPYPAENDVPNPASLVTLFGPHVVMDDSTQDGVIQISNTNSATQFAPVPVLATDGVRMQVASDQGNPITALVPFGDTLGIWRRRGFWQLYGTNPTNFAIRQLNDWGCIAPDSCVRCGHIVLFLADDGVRALAYEVSFEASLISKEIQQTLRMFSAAQKNVSKAAFWNNSYWLNIGLVTLEFNLWNRKWATHKL